MCKTFARHRSNIIALSYEWCLMQGSCFIPCWVDLCLFCIIVNQQHLFPLLLYDVAWLHFCLTWHLQRIQSHSQLAKVRPPKNALNLYIPEPFPGKNVGCFQPICAHGPFHTQIYVYLWKSPRGKRAVPHGADEFFPAFARAPQSLMVLP